MRETQNSFSKIFFLELRFSKTKFFQDLEKVCACALGIDSQFSN